MNLNLPEPITVYLAADASQDMEALALCFASDAVVRDEGGEYRGVDAIKAWQQDAHAKYSYVLEPLDATVDGQTVKLGVRLSGPFPGSPVEPDYTFTLADGKIASLVIE
jgi:hypothetical protein